MIAPLPLLQEGKQASPMQHAKDPRHRYSSMWILDSSKLNVRLYLFGDAKLCRAVLAEGDQSVSHYSFDVPPITFIGAGGRTGTAQADCEFHHVDGQVSQETICMNPKANPDDEEKLAALRNAASATGIRYSVFSRSDLKGKEKFIDNWIVLLGCINRARPDIHPCFAEIDALENCLRLEKQPTLGRLLSIDGIDRARMLAVIGRALQLGAIRTNLTTALFGRSSIISAAIE
ncbi:hypothetical protein SB861_25505 [Paraburkholderia sp. SIMBA_049]